MEVISVLEKKTPAGKIDPVEVQQLLYTSPRKPAKKVEMIKSEEKKME